jgi:hypothetical protein
VGDVGSGGEGVGPESVFFSLTAANGDQLIGNPTANLLTGCGHTAFTPNLFNKCEILSGTGRFLGASSLDGLVADGNPLQFYFEIMQGNQMLVNAVFTAPRLGGQNFLVQGLTAITAISVVANSSCPSGVRIDFNGALPQLGQVTGVISYCSS